MKTFNLNNFVKVKLTDYGKDLFYHRQDEFNSFVGKQILTPQYPHVDEEGFTEFQLHEFMNVFGRYMTVGFNNIIENNNIYICEKDLEDCDELQKSMR